MSYQILRIVKLNKISDITASAAHNFREMTVTNCDSARTHQNKTIGAATGNELVNSFYNAIRIRGIKVRNKNTVKLIEFLITASSEFFNDKKIYENYFQTSIQWIENKFGKENILSINYQLDEKSPHLVAYVMPVFNCGLNAKHFFGGVKKMSLFQDEFYTNVANRFELERGLKGSKAKHLTANKFYEITNQNPIIIPNPPQKSMIGTYSKSEVDDYVMQTKKLTELAKVNQYQRLQNSKGLS